MCPLTSKFKSVGRGKTILISSAFFPKKSTYLHYYCVCRYLEREILFDQDEDERGSDNDFEDLIRDNLKGSCLTQKEYLFKSNKLGVCIICGFIVNFRDSQKPKSDTSSERFRDGVAWNPRNC